MAGFEVRKKKFVPGGKAVVVLASGARASAEKPSGRVQVNVCLPLAVHTRLRLASVRRGEPLAGVLADLVERHLPEA